ncbi:MAG: ferrous iron transporter B [Burkholderiaceae bacterium]|nr:ferrous iron transporter B [Burkholderiaceae bacterium]
MSQASAAPLHIALVGNPNCGKTALFNRLTGSRQKVANYAGVTVERKEGHFETPAGRTVRVLDLPGTYSLSAVSPDEAITRDLCHGRIPGEPMPDLFVCVADATNLHLHLRLILELRALGRPMLVALNMMDAAARRHIEIDVPRLSRELGVPIVETVAIRSDGTARLLAEIDARGVPPPPPAQAALPDATELHRQVHALLAAAVKLPRPTDAIDDAIDAVVMHPVWGLVILAATMFLMFQAVFSWATPLMDAIRTGVEALGAWVGALLPAGPLNSLLINGVLAGVGAVLVFLPQILILFLFILVLEESGYLPRAAAFLDRYMVGAGLSGRSFIPLLSSFACAVPGIMATRTIQDPRDRLATIVVAPLMTCSARLPVYALLIGAFVPRQDVFGLLNLQGLVLFGLYVAGIAWAIVIAWLLKRFAPDTAGHALLLELPGYRLPAARDILIGLWERTRIFLRRVGTIIVPLTVLLWFLSSYPAPPAGAAGPAILHSFAGMIGRGLEPLFAPLGFGWQICVALVPGLAAREVAVGALGTVYALSAADANTASALAGLISAQWSLPTALSLLAWYVVAPMCVSTMVVIRRETQSWRLLAAIVVGLFALAWLSALVVYRVALALG